MKILLFIIFLTANSFITSDYLKVPLNSRSEALGNTGMIFGEEYGSFYLAPTSMQKKDVNILFVPQISFLYGSFYLDPTYMQKKDIITFFTSQLFFLNDKNSITNLAFFSRTKIGNFSIGFYMPGPFIDLLAAYSFEIYKFSFGAGLVYEKDVFRSIERKYLLGNTSIMYKSIVGNFSLSLNNFLIKVFSNSENLLIKSNSLKPNLRLGYGKEFELNYLFNKLQISAEINNLLMNSIYINDDSKDYDLYNKIHLGIEATKNIDEVSFSLRLGMKNLFPTFGLGIEFFDIGRISYAFTNDNFNRKQESRFINIFSFEGRLSNLSNILGKKALKN